MQRNFRHRYVLLSSVCLIALFGRCSSDGTAGDGDDSTERTADLQQRQEATSAAALSIVVVRSEDYMERRAQQVIPCPGGGSRTTNPDGSVTFNACSIFPGTTLNGTARITPQGGDTQGGRIELDDITGTTSDGTEFMIDGVIEEIENEDGSLTFEIDINSVTEGGGYTDTFNAQGSFTVMEDGSMSGGLTTDINDEDTNLPRSRCNFDGHNLLLEFDTLFDDACEEEPQEPEERCPAGEVCVAPGDGACCHAGGCEILSAEQCADIQGADYSAGSSCEAVECVVEDVLVYYTGNVCCWGAPHLLIGTRSTFESEQPASSFNGGGIDSSIPVVKIEVQGGFATVQEAREWLCPQIVSRFNHFWCGSNYVQMDGKNWWIGSGCDLSEVPYVDEVPESDLCE